MAMVAGLCEVELRLHHIHSLKDKRRILKKIVERTRARWPVSAAETDTMDSFDFGVVGFAFVSNDRRVVEAMLDKVVESIQALCLADIHEVEREIISWSDPWEARSYADAEREGASYDDDDDDDLLDDEALDELGPLDARSSGGALGLDGAEGLDDPDSADLTEGHRPRSEDAPRARRP
jgi:uncharacterized protein YlxP (DUF503 family)